jgi:hypothetical protein
MGKAFLISNKDSINPIKPMSISVIKNPIIETTKTLCSATGKRVENIKIAVSSLVPIPAKVMGI